LDDDSKTRVDMSMVNVGPDLNAWGRLKYKAEIGWLRFIVEVGELDDGVYSITLDGKPCTLLEGSGHGSRAKVYQTPLAGGCTLLNFDPLGHVVGIEREGETYLVAVVPASALDSGLNALAKMSKNAVSNSGG